jgi:hypothetical protein
MGVSLVYKHRQMANTAKTMKARAYVAGFSRTENKPGISTSMLFLCY